MITPTVPRPSATLLNSPGESRIVLKESIGREALLALSSSYGSVADAVLEIADNPFDYRRGRRLQLDVVVDKTRNLIRVTDCGGEGMNAQSLSEWITWGTGHAHAPTDIGQWHVGGKLACIYLADSLEILCRRDGDEDIWRFRDPKWGSRSGLFEGEPDIVDGHLAKSVRTEFADAGGFTQITLRDLKDHRYELQVIESRLANTYRALLDRGDCNITLNGAPVRAFEIPESPSHIDRRVVIKPTKLGTTGVTVKGKLWIIDRDKFRPGRGVMVQAGVRTTFNGRLITSGEEFGHYLAGRGSLQRLMGEIEISHFRPNATKNGWDKDAPEWEAIELCMHREMEPLVAFLNSLIEGRPISREMRKRAERVRRDIEETLRRIRLQLIDGGFDGGPRVDEQVAAGGRAPEQDRTPKPTSERHHETGEVRHRTPPPEDPIGRLLRRVNAGVPPIDFDNLGRTSRSQLRTQPEPRIVINRDYPLFPTLGDTDEYLVETVLLHLLTQDEDDAVMRPRELAARLDELMFVWQGVTSGTSPDVTQREESVDSSV
jgi:hypothetical protein